MPLYAILVREYFGARIMGTDVRRGRRDRPRSAWRSGRWAGGWLYDTSRQLLLALHGARFGIRSRRGWRSRSRSARPRRLPAVLPVEPGALSRVRPGRGLLEVQHLGAAARRWAPRRTRSETIRRIESAGRGWCSKTSSAARRTARSSTRAGPGPRAFRIQHHVPDGVVIAAGVCSEAGRDRRAKLQWCMRAVTRRSRTLPILL